MPVGHPGPGSTIYDQAKWQELLAKPLCAEENCLSWAEVGPIVDGRERELGKPIRGHIWPGEYYEDAFPNSLQVYCFTCAFWHEKLENLDAGSVIVEQSKERPHGFEPVVTEPVTELVCYRFDPRLPVKTVHRSVLGYGGRYFKIKFTDGREVVTNDLWHGGSVPTWFRDRFQANAHFVEDQVIDRGELSNGN